MARGSRDCPASGRAAFGRGGRALLDSKRPRSGPRRGHVGMSPSTETRGRGDEPDTNPEREKKSARKPSPRDDRSGSPRAWGLYRDYCARLGRLDVGGNLPPWLTLYLLAWAGEKVQGNSSLAPRFPTGSPFSLSARSTLAPLKFRNMNRKGKGQGPPPMPPPLAPGCSGLGPRRGSAEPGAPEICVNFELFRLGGGTAASQLSVPPRGFLAGAGSIKTVNNLVSRRNLVWGLS